MRCRLIATWGGSTSQGLGCSPMKAVRELGSERRRLLRPCRVICMINSTHNGEAHKIGHLWGIPWEVDCYSIHILIAFTNCFTIWLFNL